jgi:maltose alpha-D-glucosyltransferase / alpha-amylase
MHADLPWYTNAVIYGVDVSKFADGNGDGVGDFVGLADRLPYLRELGVTCIWLLPFYKTPGRDNGYDISHYLSVDPRLGTMADFTAFLHKAGEQGIRVLADLVVNHTSDEHPWFRAARNSRQSLFRHYYLWSDEPPPVDVGEQSALPGDEDSVWQFD